MFCYYLFIVCYGCIVITLQDACIAPFLSSFYVIFYSLLCHFQTLFIPYSALFFHIFILFLTHFILSFYTIFCTLLNSFKPISHLFILFILSFYISLDHPFYTHYPIDNSINLSYSY